jgi:hypothetical protein
VLLSAVVAQGVQIAIGMWLGYWSADTLQQSQWYYMGVYGALTAGNFLFLVISAMVLAYVGSVASGVLHDKAFKSLLYAPMAFFGMV